MNLFRERELLKTVRTRDVFFLWKNAPCVILGRNQIAEEEVDLEYAAKMQIPVLYRDTGGGAVYQDPGNLNFTIITDCDPTVPVDLKALTEPIRTALQTLGVPAEFNGRNDLTACGRKICGTAYRIDGDRILAHGCLDFSVDTDLMDRILTPPPQKLERHGIRSVRSRVLPIRELLPEMTIDEFADFLADHVTNLYLSRHLP